MDHVRGESKDRQLGKPRGKKLGVALEEYRRHQRRTVAPTTYSTHRAPLQALIDEFGEHTLTTAVTKERLQAMLDTLTDAGFKPATVQFQRNCWSKFFRTVGDWNPTKGTVCPPRAEVEEIFAWSYSEWMRVRSRAQKSHSVIPIALILDLAVCTGARINEVLALRYEDFNRATGTVRISRQFEPGCTFVRPPKGSGRKMNARTALCLPELWEWYDMKGRGLIVLNGGEPVTSKRANQVLKGILKANLKTDAGVRMGGLRRSFHDCRRTYVRQWVERGASMVEVQKWCGHSSIVTTEKNYPAFSAEQAAANAMARLYPKAAVQRRA